MTRKLLSFVCIVFTLLVTGCEKQQAPVKVGVVIEKTGAMSHVGTAAEHAASIALKEMNAQGGLLVEGKKHPVQLIIEDDQSTPEGAIAAVKKLTEKDHVLAIIGPNTSQGAIPAGNIAEEKKTLLITPWATAPAVTIDPATTKHKQYVFRACFSDTFQIKILTNFARYTKNYKTAAVLYNASSAAPTTQATLFKEDFEKLGGKVVAFESFQMSNPNFTEQLKRIKAANPEVLFLPNYYPNVVAIAKEAKQLGIQSELLGADSWNSPKDADRAIEGGYFIAHYSADAPTKETQDFITKYKQAFGNVPNDVAALNYDAFQVLFKAIQAATTLTPEAVKKALVDLPAEKGVTGSIDYSPNLGGEPLKSAVILQIKNGQSAWVTYANP